MACKGKNALVTGACGGLGRAIAEAFLREDANVVVCDIRENLISDFSEKVSAAYPERTLVLECDITKDSALDDMFAQAKKTFGHLDIVVNCAGMMDRFDPIGQVERTMWDRVLALNLTAPAMVTQRAVDMMMKSNIKGSIVNIASIASIVGFVSGAAYTTAKHGLIGLTKNTAAYYGADAGIRCNAILPGGMQTNIVQNFGSELNREGLGMMRRTYPEDIPQFVEVDKVAKLVIYLCSDAGEIMNGACIVADRGLTSH